MSLRFKNTMSSIHAVLKLATKTLSSKINDQILWPSDVEYPTISEMFREVSNLKGCIGALGISYIKIPKPKEESESYMCAKNYACVALQGVVTINGKFLDIFINEGSFDAEQILQKSNLLTEAEHDLLGDYFVVGCNSYSSRQWLVQPFEDDGSLTSNHTFFNSCHSAAANLFPESLGFVKGRFQRLQNFENRDIDIVTQCIESACMIHNLAIDCEDDHGDFLVTDTGIFRNDFMDFSSIGVHDDGGKREKLFEELLEDETRISEVP